MNPTQNRDLGLIPMPKIPWRRGSGKLLQYSWLKNSTDRGAKATVHGSRRVGHNLATKYMQLCQHRNMICFSHKVHLSVTCLRWRSPVDILWMIIQETNVRLSPLCLSLLLLGSQIKLMCSWQLNLPCSLCERMDRTFLSSLYLMVTEDMYLDIHLLLSPPVRREGWCWLHRSEFRIDW